MLFPKFKWFCVNVKDYLIWPDTVCNKAGYKTFTHRDEMVAGGGI